MGDTGQPKPKPLNLDEHTFSGFFPDYRTSTHAISVAPMQGRQADRALNAHNRDATAKRLCVYTKI